MKSRRVFGGVDCQFMFKNRSSLNANQFLIIFFMPSILCLHTRFLKIPTQTRLVASRGPLFAYFACLHELIDIYSREVADII